jgi:hypothetical protein
LTPPSARTVRLAGSTRMPFILLRSITIDLKKKIF